MNSPTRIRVRLFAAARDRAGCESITVTCPAPATVASLRQQLGRAYPALESLLPHAMFAVDHAYLADDAILEAQSEVALIPPVSGG